MKSFILILIMALTACPFVSAHDYRVAVNVYDVTASREDTLIMVPVHISHTLDTIAGVELYFVLDENRNLSFAMDNVRQDGLWLAVDTAGTIMSGWEWIGISSIEDGFFDLKVSGMADWPNQTLTQPALPAEDELLVKLFLRFDDYFPLSADTVFSISIDPEKSGFSDPHGNSIGVITKTEKICQQYAGDSCAVWKTVRRGYLDTTVVHFESGSVTFIDTLGGHK